MNRDHLPIVVSKFSGLYDRGFDDVCPADHFLSGKNFIFTQDGPKTRDGLTLANAVGNAKRIALYARLDEVPRRLILDNAGRIYDSLNLGVPILTIAGMTDFASITFGNRIYISPHNGNRGLENQVIYVYDGTTCRTAAGTAPAGTITASNSMLSGNVDAGMHLFAIAYETESGFITRPGPTLYASLTTPGDRQVDLSGIPIGPAGTIARRVLVTKRIPNYDGNQNAYEFFFVPTGRIANNTATTVTVNFFDVDLVSSADYLFDQLQTIPAGINMTIYKSRIVVMNTFTNPSIAWFSKQNDPESFDAVEGFKEIDLSEAGGLTNGVEFRDSFYMCKDLHTYATTADDELGPIFWQTITIDGGIGATIHGIATLLDSTRGHTDRIVIGSRAGLMLFDGSYNSPEFSWKIRDYWDRITLSALHKVQVFTDPVQKLIYVNVPLDGATECSHVLVGDYKNGMGPLEVRWSLWQFPNPCTAICLDLDADDNPYLLVSQTAGVNKLTVGATSDYGNAIDTVIRFALLMLDENGGLSHVDSLRLRVRGVGNLQVKLYGEDDVLQQTLQSATLSVNPGRELTRLVNFINERCSVELRTNQFGEYFNINRMVLFVAPVWSERPM